MENIQFFYVVCRYIHYFLHLLFGEIQPGEGG
jgi:hypothetical protein